jgi:hypothetical protein
VNEDAEISALIDEKESNETEPEKSSVVDQEAMMVEEKESNETQPKEDEAPQESSVVDQEAVAEEKESNETQPKEDEAPQESSVVDQETVEEVWLHAEEETCLKTEVQARLTAENIRKAEEQVATKNNSNLSFGKLCNDLLTPFCF